MPTTDPDLGDRTVAAEPVPTGTRTGASPRAKRAELGASMAAVAVSTAACGGGGNNAEPASIPGPTAGGPAPAPAPAPAPGPAPGPVPPAPLTDADAARLLLQAAFAAPDSEIASVKALGAGAWLDAQFERPVAYRHWDWMIANGYAVVDNANGFRGLDNTLWNALLSAPDAVRQRVALALSEIFVVSMNGLPVRWRGMVAAAYMDVLTQHAFSNFRTLLEAVTLSTGMGNYLNMRGNQKEDVATGRQPDENFAREVMQLFTIGLVQLEADGSTKTNAQGQPLDTYSNDDIAGLARALTGWDHDGFSSTNYEWAQRPMAFNPARHSTSAKRFLGAAIAAGSTDGVGELRLALDTLFQHPNVGPFFGQLLIQRLVTSNPSRAYVSRVSAAFANNGQGVRGDMKAVLRAVLLDTEARTPATSPQGGRLSEPVVRFVQWARSFGATSPAGTWNVGDTSSPSTRLGQSPLRSPSVFNFFRPGYVPPNSAIGTNRLKAPEFQITNESSVVAYANFMQNVIANGVGDVRADYSSLLPLSSDPGALFDKLNLRLAAGRLSAATRGVVVGAVGAMAAGNDTQRLRRVHATVLLIATCPEYLVVT